MRREKWKAEYIFNNMRVLATAALGEKAEEVAAEVRRTVAPKKDRTYRRPRWQSPNPLIKFTPGRGRNKNREVSFRGQRWMGRYRGGLKSTIRVVQKEGRDGSFRVIAGNYKAYWAPFAEYGVPGRDIPKSLFMRAAFNRVAPTIKSHIEKAVS